MNVREHSTSLASPASIEQRHRFEQLVHKWRLAEMGPGPDCTHDQQLDWERPEAEEHRMDLARAVLHFPTPSGTLCLMRDKLDVLIHFASALGEDMDPAERVLIDGICALRADIIHHGG